MRTSESHPLIIAEVILNGAKIGLSLCPGKKQPDALTGSWNRDLDQDLKKIREEGYDAVLSLIDENEMEDLQVTALQNGAVISHSMEWIWAPILDGWIPDDDIFLRFDRALDIIEEGGSVFVHCKGGLGRAGLVAAWILTHNGRSAKEAIHEVRSVRSGAIETGNQEKWIELKAGVRTH